MITIDTISKKYGKAEVKWVQEEPQNMGAWQYLNSFWRRADIEVISRKVSASPATGFKKVHEGHQAEIVEKSFK